jgi:hypothetical protein
MSEQPPRESFPAGAVTNVHGPITGWPSAPPLPGAPRPGRPNRELAWWLTGAGVLLAAGLTVVLVLIGTGQLGSGPGIFSNHNQAPPDMRPPLAKLCPPPSGAAEVAPAPADAVPSGPRTTDDNAGISYRAYGSPWKPWPFLWRAGTLEVPYGVGQHFVTEQYAGGEYHASILSGAVPATVNDGLAVDISCVGHQVAADVRAEYYPTPNTTEALTESLTTLGGMPAWVTTFRMHFDEPGLRAKDELVGLAVLNVGRPTVAVLYVSIPGTNHEWDRAVDEVLASVRPT